jgi:hypothetical protein
MDTDNTQEPATPSPASAGYHGDKCRCGLATRLVGDGCEHCNPAMMIDILREQVAEMRLTDKEREALVRLCDAVTDYAADDRKTNGEMFAADDERAVAIVRGWLARLT